jgi:tetratricopeptide (TPR) repeat protein
MPSNTNKPSKCWAKAYKRSRNRRSFCIKPDNAHAYNALGYTFAERNIRLTEALELVEKAYQLAPDDPAILDSMGWVHYRLGNLDKGLDFLRKAIIARPDPEVAAHLAEVLVARGERREAKSVSDKALKENPDNEALTAVVKRLDLK